MKTPLKIALIALVVVVAAAGVGLWWFFKDDAPAPVSLGSAVESVTDSTAASTTSDAASDSTGTSASTSTADSAATTGATAAETADGGVAGTWLVDTETGEFDYESATGTFAGFRIEEELASIGSTTAVGRTGDVAGSMVIDGRTVTEATFDIDLSTITTNESRRDDNVQRALETGQFPTATFTLVEPIDLGDAVDSGEAVSVTAIGDLTIHGVTQRVGFPLEAQLVQGTVVVVGSLDVTFADYGVEVPDAQIVLSVEDHGILELQLLLTKS
jgi:polyisoprenoid-binding protein YceI